MGEQRLANQMHRSESIQAVLLTLENARGRLASAELKEYVKNCLGPNPT